MSEYTLYGFAQSGNAYKVALCLELAGADWAPRFVDYFNGETHTPAYRAINVMGEAPVLEHGELRLSQSGVILDYLAERYTQFGPRDATERREILRWLLWDNHKLTSYTATYRFLRTFTANPEPAVLAEFGKRARANLAILDAHLAARNFVATDRPTIADFSLCGYLYFDEELGLDWTALPHVDAWRNRLRALPGWKHPHQLLPGHPLVRRPA
jgi:glutathione S-transferase